MVLCYKFGYPLEYVTSLTIPQIRVLESNLSNILKAENGGDKEGGTSEPVDPSDDRRHMANRVAFGGVLETLKKRTGRDSFTLSEMQDPAGTIRKYNKGK